MAKHVYQIWSQKKENYNTIQENQENKAKQNNIEDYVQNRFEVMLEMSVIVCPEIKNGILIGIISFLL